MVWSMIFVQISVFVSEAPLEGREMRRGGIRTMQLDVQFTKKLARSHDMAPKLAEVQSETVTNERARR